MKPLSLNPRDRRALVWGLAFIMVVVGWFRVVPMVRTWSNEGVAAGLEMRRAVARAERVLEDFPVVSESTRARAQDLLDLAPLVFPARGDAGSGAALASHVGLLARRAGIRIGSISILRDTSAVVEHETFRRVRVTGSGEGAIDGVSRFISAVESGAPLSYFSSLAIEQPQPNAEPSQAERLRVSFVIQAIALAGGAS